ncbi:adenylosuccinate synthase [Natranaerobius trueperi]|uniref:Adenylosuccinate synthetase n=1 Tax=Natranaerobius trueperi TaxID=759412 RepID=A0A226BWX1_9FIRM|nr:adenylosuccinate synthase [Natranaerobius trueperi]OWZ83496.1 adenylosuccinate synthase [Natranaerobius trueperi]
MSGVVVVGTQWGDEGKGKITDFLAETADVIVRYQGGNNAGHTVKIGEKEYKLHLIPSGIFYGGKTCVLGNGMVIDPQALIDELDYLKQNSVEANHLVISDRAHVIMPYHKVIDGLEESSRGEQKIGTTGKGIGPCYMDKASRVGIRMSDLQDDEELEEKIRLAVTRKNLLLEKMYDVETFDPEEVISEYKEYAKKIRPYIKDTSVILERFNEEKKKMVFEGAQGTLLDLDHGTYPYVTASNPVVGGACSGTGVAPSNISDVAGVVKAYCTRVGDGPFPSELTNEIGDRIREKGNEFGTTTGRPRRTGWLDTVILNYAKRINGLNHIVLTLVDVLSGFETVKICVGYKYRGEVIKHFPASQKILSECSPIYEEIPGWYEDISQIEKFEDFPDNARKYVKRIEELTSLPVSIVSVGPKRSQTKVRNKIFE